MRQSTANFSFSFKMAADRTKGYYNLGLSTDDPKCFASRTSSYRRRKRISSKNIEDSTDPAAFVHPNKYYAEEDATDSSDEKETNFSQKSIDVSVDSLSDEIQQLDDLDEVEIDDLFTDGNIGSDSEASNADSYDEFESFDYGKPLYDGAMLTEGVSYFLIARFLLKHKLTNAALGDLLKLIELHCPSPNLCCKSAYFMKKFQNSTGQTGSSCEAHEYCANCYVEIADKGSLSCVKCRTPIKEASSKCEFVTISIEDQLRDLFRLPEFSTAVTQSQKKVTREGTYSDINDGECFLSTSQAASQSCFDGCILTAVWNTDGVPIFKSSGFSLWPIYLIINELPYHLRIKPEYILLSGLWSGTKKPPMDVLLKPLVMSMKSLSGNGLSVSTPSGKLKCKFFAIAGTLDLIAKAPALNMIQFNGLYGCSKCLQKGHTVTIGGGHTHVYPYNSRNPSGPPRLAQMHKHFCSEALSTAQTVYGVKGPSCVTELPCFDVIRGMAVDYMHQAVLGVGRQLLKLWFLSKYHGCSWYIGRKIQEVDVKLMSVCPTIEVGRLPRRISDTLKYWKAHELRTWLLYYSLPVLKDILPANYFNHHIALVSGLYCLLKDSVQSNDLLEAKTCFEYYCSVFCDLYGEEHMTINVHTLLHLVEDVRSLGPLWCHSCFAFENMNGVLKELFHGSQQINKQIVNTLFAMKKMPLLFTYLRIDSTPSHLDCLDRHPLHRYRYECIISSHVTLLQKPFSPEFTPRERDVVSTYYENLSELSEYSKLKFGNRIVKSLHFSMKTRRNDSCISFSTPNSQTECCFGLVLKILLDRNQLSALLVSPLTIKGREYQLPQSDCGIGVSHIVCVSRYSDPNHLQLIPVENVLRKCLLLELSGDIFVCTFVNNMEEF